MRGSRRVDGQATAWERRAHVTSSGTFLLTTARSSSQNIQTGDAGERDLDAIHVSARRGDDGGTASKTATGLR
eukprot:2308372-Pleurochrysis_carterae.AAC.2